MALQFTEREFIPVLLGGDINAYSVARAFYEEYQVKSLVFGKYQTGPAYRSQIIDYTPNVDIDTMRALQHARAVPEEGDLLRAVREAWRALSAHVYLYQGDAQCPG